MSDLRKRIEAGAKWMPGFGQTPIPPRLSTLAKFIRETWPTLKVTLVPWTTSTDRKAGRLRIPGRGREGKLLTVQDPAQDPHGFGLHGVLLRHESGDPYRHNGEVCEWIVRRLRGGGL